MYKFVTYSRLPKIILMIGFCFYVTQVQTQISPGKLSKEHTSLEGISNCTACHDLGAKISEQKCLNCHKELKTRITQNKGYHVSRSHATVSTMV
jgi:uncharacterized paraquat-inducible protein A